VVFFESRRKRVSRAGTCCSQSKELKQCDFRRGAAEASRGHKLRFALAQEGCSKACLDGEAHVWHGQSAHSSLRSSLPSCVLHPKHGDRCDALCQASHLFSPCNQLSCFKLERVFSTAMLCIFVLACFNMVLDETFAGRDGC